jgi:integrase
MARTIQDARLDSRDARKRLALGRDHFRTIVPGKLHLGYRRKAADQPGVWFVRRYMGGERYKVASLGLADDRVGEGLTFEAADRAARAHKLAQGEVPLGQGTLTVGEAMRNYLVWLSEHKATGRDAALRAEKLILPQLGRIKVAELTTPQLRRWLDDLAAAPRLVRSKAGGPPAHGRPPKTPEEKRVRKASANRVWNTLRAALNRAFKGGLVSDDTAWRRIEAFGGTDAARPGFLSIDEAQRLINAADASGGFKALITGALMTGARYGELCAMRVGDYQRGKIHIPRSKSGKPRDITLTAEGRAFFTALTIGRPADALIFTRGDGSPWRAQNQMTPMRQTCRAAQINPPIGFHQLRHSYASISIMNGMPMMIVAQNLGHASTAMVQKHYGHLSASYVDEQVEKFGPRFGIVEPSSNVVPIMKTK